MNEEMTAKAGDHLYSFDGRVLEVFGTSTTIRFHVRHMHIRAKGLHHKGKWFVVDISHGHQSSVGRHMWTYSIAKSGDLSDLVRLLDAVAAAIG